MVGDSIPFFVEVPYAMRPHMRQRDPGEPILTRDGDFERYQQEKNLWYDPVYGDNSSPELVWDCIRALRGFDDSLPEITQEDPVRQLTQALQEDFVIWAPNRAGDLSAQVLSVCLPSGWNPREKANKTFLEIHEPIPEFDLVNKASAHISRMITTRGPFIRHVWSLANAPDLNRHPSRYRPWTNEDLDNMWYRTERQVTIPVAGQAALFLIRVYQCPLREIFQDPEKRQKIIDSIASMTPAVIDYKGFGYLRDYFSRHVE
jgi:hypothetical protein